MKIVRALVTTALALIVSGQAATAQDLSKYRVYVLGSSLDSVIAASGVRAADVRTLHERPARIQELQWRAPYVSSGTEAADPVRGIVFTFYDDRLYQIVVNYDRAHTAGLTNADVIESLSATYGLPVLASTRTGTGPSADARPDAVVVARWDDPASSLILLSDAYSHEFQLILTSNVSSARARSAITEAARLDAAEAPGRELETRKREAAEVTAALEKTRTTNKAAFRP